VALPGGGAVAYEVHGAGRGGTPLVLLRPLGGTVDLWGAFRSTLAASRRVISVEHRGAGRSSAAPALVTTAGLARDALGVLDHLGTPRFHLFGESLGGMAATWLAAMSPGRTTSLCQASTPLRGVELTNAAIRRELALAGAFAARPSAIEARLVHQTLSAPFRARDPQEVGRILDVVGRDPASPGALVRLALAGAAHDARRPVAALDVPTLVLAGEDDELLGVDPSRALAAALRRADLDVIAQAGHAITLEQPTVAATRVASFIEATGDR
jgi:pimeloyl-ACP methyl ester carboxylesterase